MRGVWLVARRDFWAYINTLWGWGVLALALGMCGLFFNFWAMGTAPKYSADVLEGFFYVAGGIVLIASVFVTMRLFAEERQTGTMVLLDSSPYSEMEIVLGKYVSAMLFMAMFCLFSLYMPAMIFVNGKVSYQEILVGYLGTFAMASAGVAIGTWASAISRNQLIAGVIAAVVLVFFVASWWLSPVTDPPFRELTSYVAFFNQQFKPFQEGRIDTQGLVFFASVTFAFLLLAKNALVSRRWE